MRDGVAAGYGILTVENEAQALVRASPDAANGGRDKGGEAVRACLALIDLKRRFAGNAAMNADRRRRATRRAKGRRRERGGAASPGLRRSRRSISWS